MYDWNGDQLYILKKDEYGESRHMTNVFNIFVILQIFNMINARKINNEFNIFEGIFTNKMFVGVWLAIVVLQIIIVEVGSTAMKVAPGGLPW